MRLGSLSTSFYFYNTGYIPQIRIEIIYIAFLLALERQPSSKCPISSSAMFYKPRLPFASWKSAYYVELLWLSLFPPTTLSAA